MAIAKLSRVNFGSDQVPVWQQLHHSASVTTSDGDVLVLDLVKLSLLSPFFKDVIDSFSIPSSLRHILDVNIILPDFNSDVIGVLVEVLEGMVADVTDAQIKCIKDLLKVLGLKVGLLKDGEKINSVKSAKSKPVVEESQLVQIKIGKCKPVSSLKPTPKEVTKTKDTIESRTVKFRSHEEPNSKKLHLEKKNLKKKDVVKGGLRERASLNSIKKKVDEERRQRNKIILQSVKRLGFGGNTNNMNSSMPHEDDGWVSREGRVVENFSQGNDELVRMPSDMIGNPMNIRDGFVGQQPYEGSRQVVDSNSVRQVVWGNGSQVGDQNMNEVVWGDQRRCLLQRDVAIDPRRYETEQVYFRNNETGYEGGMDYRSSENMGMEEWGNISIDGEYGGSNRGGNMGMINAGMVYQGGDMRSEREGRVEQRGVNIGIMNEGVNLRGGNMQSERDYEVRKGYGNRREVEELAAQSYSREILEDENSEDCRSKRKRKSYSREILEDENSEDCRSKRKRRGSKPRRKKSDLDGELSYNRRTRREGNEFRDGFRERSSSNSQFGDHFEKRIPHRDYSR